MINKKSLLTIGIIFVLIATMQFSRSGLAAIQVPNNSCADCHRNLLFSSDNKQFVDIRLRHIESGISCSIDCHEDKINKSIASSYALWSISPHSQYNVYCDKCHGGNPLVASKSDAHIGLSNDSIQRANTPEMCGKCHDSQLNEFKNSMHFKRLESGEDVAPACITCHQAHSVHVLTSSELQDFCINCHNNITGIDPTVPKRAEAALLLASELKSQFSMVKANLSGNLTDNQTEDLNAAEMILKNIPSVWHRFDLNYFDTQVQQGILYVNDAKNISEGVETNTKKTPGFESISLIIGVLLMYFVRKLKK